MKVRERKAAQRAALRGRAVRAVIPLGERVEGCYRGVVRSVRFDRAGQIRELTMQRPGGRGLVDGSAVSVSARCAGDLVRIRAPWVDGVRWRGAWLPLSEYLRRRGCAAPITIITTKRRNRR